MTTVPAEPSVTVTVQPPRACVVALAGQRFAIEVRHAREVVVFDGYTIVPLAPAHLLGVANLRGNVLPIVDVRPLLGMSPAAAGHDVRALVVEHDGVQAALLIDEVLGLEPLEGVVPAGGDDGLMIAGHLDREGGPVTVLHVSAVLSALAGETATPGEGASE